MTYVPDGRILERYAALLVNFGLGKNGGINSGDVVRIITNEDAKPLHAEVCKAVWRAGGHVITEFNPADDADINITAAFYELASDTQLDWAPLHSRLALIEQIDHSVHLFCERDPRALQDVDPAKLFRHQQASEPITAARNAKEDQGRYSWTMGLYGVPGMAAEAGLTIEEYWQQIIKGCLLEDPDPVASWHAVNRELGRQAEWLTSLQIHKVRIEGEDADLSITIGPSRRFIGEAGNNIPGFEVFTSPDWRGTEGWIRFNQPMYHFGSLIEGIELRFAKGRVTDATATHNQRLLTELIAADEGAGQLGEFSLTDNRLSPIEQFMAESLYDENMGGPYGNTHIALGDAYAEAYDGDPAQLTAKQREELGFNRSSIHTDIVSTTDRTVTATLADGSTVVIYEHGRFTLP